MVASASFADFLPEQLARLGPVAMRRMFGMTGDTMDFRVGDLDRAIFEEAGSLHRPVLWARAEHWPDALLARARVALERVHR
jgi:hypothetical protein